MKTTDLSRLVLSLFAISSLVSFRAFAMFSSAANIITHSLSEISANYANEDDNGLKTCSLGWHHFEKLFTKAQCETIRQKNLASLISELLAHKKITIKRGEHLLDFANTIKDSSLTLKQIESRLVKYLSQGDLLFTALNKAISREQFNRWKTLRNETVLKNGSPFIKSIKALDLNQNDQKKVVNAFAVCIDSFRQPIDRVMLSPSICDPELEYTIPFHGNRVYSLRANTLEPNSSRNDAYQALVKAATEVASAENLDVFERVIMAKCIAEQSLKFFEPSRHPLTALRKVQLMEEVSPQEAFFMNKGVCNNFSAITYNFAIELGLKNQIYLAKRHVHVYLELEVDNVWYHTHPFNSSRACDFTRFK